MTANTGKYAVAYRREDGEPWIGLPGVATEGGDIHTMFSNARLGDWNIEKRLIDTGARTDSPDFEVVRTNPDDGGLDRLAVTKERYEVYSNEDVLSFADNVAFADLTPVAMGSLNGGRKVFMSFALGGAITVQGTDDEVQTYLNVRTSHDGSWAFGTWVGNMRLRCQNMLTSSKAQAFSSFTIRHTKTMAGRIEDARTALGIGLKSQSTLASDMAALAAVDMSDNAFWSLVERIYPRPEKDVKGALKKWETKTDTIMGIWNGDTLEGLDNTAYKAYNALNESLMWYAGVRDGNVENALVRASGFDDFTNKKNVDLYKAVLLG